MTYFLSSTHGHWYYDIEFYNDRIRTIVTRTAAVVDQWIADISRIHRRKLHKLVIGLDTEWRPNNSRNDNNPVAILQLCVGRRCLVFQLLHADIIPLSLYAFLNNQNFTFVGVGIQNDVEKLLEDHGLCVSRTMDLKYLANLRYESKEFKRMGLKRLALEVVGKVMEKPRNVTMSRWDDTNLTAAQSFVYTVSAKLERHRGERIGDYRESHRNTHSGASSRSSEDPVTHHDRDYVDNYRAGFSGEDHHHHRHDHRRQHHHHNFPNAPNDSFGSGGFRSSSVGGNGSGDNLVPLSGRKRGFPHSARGPSPAVPTTATEEDIRPLFEEYGNIVEVVLIKDKRTGLQQECCFVKYATLEEADRAIRALHGQYILPGGVAPIKVRYADGERERLGALEYKLYVGFLNKQASKQEIEEIFSPYGLVEEVYIVRDELKQSRGCGFIKFSHREMAVAAINALNGTYVMRGCDQPLTVRFADPKKPRIGESRGNFAFVGPGFGPCSQEPVVRPAPNLGDLKSGRTHPGGPTGVIGGPATGSLPGHGLPSSAPQQSPRTGSKPQTVARTSTGLEVVVPSTISAAPAAPISIQTVVPLECDWSEHTCPDGYKYYYNCVTCESRWEKPEEFTLFEQQLQQQQQLKNPSSQQLQSLSYPEVLSTHQVFQIQQVQLRTKLSRQELQQPSLSGPELGHVQVQAATSPVIGPACV